MKPFPPEMSRLVQAYLTSELTAEEAQRFVVLAENDPEVLDTLIEQLRINTMLKDFQRVGIVRASLAKKVAEEIEHRDRPLVYLFQRHPVLLSFLAASMLFLCVLIPMTLWLGIQSLSATSKPIPSGRPPVFVVKETIVEKENPGPPVGVLESAVQVVWDRQKIVPEIGDVLYPGELKLLDGIIQIRFQQGAVVVVEGPATVQLLTPDRIGCTDGKLNAVIPATAVGFRVDLPWSSLIDLGTIFSVDVSEQRHEIQTLQGAVLLTVPSQREKMLLKSAEAVRFNAKKQVRRYRADLTSLGMLASLMKKPGDAEAGKVDAFFYEQIKSNRNRRVLLPDCFVIAAKGVSTHAPENTIAAFQAALDINVDACEMDILLSADDELFVQYPGTIENISPGKRPMRKLTSQQVRALRFPRGNSEAEGVPTFDDALTFFKDFSCWVVVDLFEIEAVPSIVNKIREHAMEERIVFSTPVPEIVVALKQTDPTFCVGLLVTINPKLSEDVILEKIISQVESSGADFVRLHVDLFSPQRYQTLKAKGLPVWYYASSEDKENDRLLELIETGVDGIMTPQADRLTKMREQRTDSRKHQDVNF